MAEVRSIGVGVVESSRITSGPDGNLWFTEVNTNKIGKCTTAGVITEFTVPTANSGPAGHHHEA
jgi:streptogramin lyase